MTRLIPREILARIANPQLVQAARPEALRCELEREPPKVFLAADPVPFPPALAGACALLALAWSSPLWLAAAALLILVPVAALWRQRIGERRLQDHLSGLLGDCTWNPRAH